MFTGLARDTNQTNKFTVDNSDVGRKPTDGSNKCDTWHIGRLGQCDNDMGWELNEHLTSFNVLSRVEVKVGLKACTARGCASHGEAFYGQLTYE